jgi:hypothetical protein
MLGIDLTHSTCAFGILQDFQANHQQQQQQLLQLLLLLLLLEVCLKVLQVKGLPMSLLLETHSNLHGCCLSALLPLSSSR